MVLSGVHGCEGNLANMPALAVFLIDDLFLIVTIMTTADLVNRNLVI